MPTQLDARHPGFAAAFAALVADRREAATDVSADVAAIVADVRARGDAALIDLTARFDRLDLTAATMRVSAAEVDAAVAAVPPATLAALELAAARIAAFHAPQRPSDHDSTDAAGVRAGWRWNAVDAAGLYVPGGQAAYPSSVLMNAIPARVAGVARLVMVTPAPGGVIAPLVLAAARLAGVDEIYRVGGAQAVAALAFGTASIAPVDVIVGPGNAWVAEAKRQLFGVVGIDMVAGPSEVVIVADAAANPEWLALDLLAQAEHDAAAQSILITDDFDIAQNTANAVRRLLDEGRQRVTAAQSWDDNGRIIVVTALADAIPLVDALAPEHLQLMLDNPMDFFDKIRHAGSVFLGRHTPEAAGDYLAGPNHVLPTGRRARFASGLGVTNFMKRTTFLDCGVAGLAAIGDAGATLADAEGLPAHAASIRVRKSPAS